METNQVTVFLTENQAPYLSGVLEEEILIEEFECITTSTNGEIVVNWKVNNDWIDEESLTVLTVHVQKHQLKKDGALWFTYRLRVQVNATGTYHFTDATGDRYKLDVSITSRIHHVDYNSSDPRITKVEFTSK